MKTTSRIFAYVLAIAMIVSCGIVNASAKTDYTGKWIGYEMESDGEVYDYDDISLVYPDESLYLELKKDGSAVLNSADNYLDCTWKDNKIVADIDIKFEVKGDLLYMEEVEGCKFTFVKVGSDTYNSLKSDDKSESESSKSDKKSESSKSESSKSDKKSESKTESSKSSDKKSSKKTDSDKIPDSDASVHDEITIDSTEVYNKDGIVVTIKKVTLENADKKYGSYELTYSVQNDSDKDVAVSSDMLTVNGIMFNDSSLYETVNKGKKANGTFELYLDNLEDIGVGTIADLGINVRVCDADSYDDIGIGDMVNIKTSADGTFNQTVDDSGIVVYENDDFKLVAKEVNSDDYNFGVFKYYIENKSDKNLLFTSGFDDTYINDTSADVSFYPIVAAGCKMYYDAKIYSDADELDIESYKDIETLEFELLAYDYNATTSHEPLVDETVQITFESK